MISIFKGPTSQNVSFQVNDVYSPASIQMDYNVLYQLCSHTEVIIPSTVKMVGGVKTEMFQKGWVCPPPHLEVFQLKKYGNYGLSRAWWNACMYVYMYVRTSKMKGCAIPSLG